MAMLCCGAFKMLITIGPCTIDCVLILPHAINARPQLTINDMWVTLTAAVTVDSSSTQKEKERKSLLAPTSAEAQEP